MHDGKTRYLAIPEYRKRCQFSLRATCAFTTMVALVMGCYVYWSQRDARRMAADIAESKSLSQVDKGLLRALVHEKSVMSSDLAFELGLYWTETWYYPDGPTERHVAATCGVLWSGSGPHNRAGHFRVFVVATNQQQLDRRSEHVIIVLDHRQRILGWRRLPGYDLEFVSATMKPRQDDLELVVVERWVIERAKLTYSISSKGPRLVAIETTRDTSRIKKLMPFLNIDGTDGVASTPGEQPVKQATNEPGK